MSSYSTNLLALIQRSSGIKVLMVLIPLMILYIILSHPFSDDSRSGQDQPPCPYTWHGGSPTHRGSCWCGADDKYCMCTPSLAIDAIIEYHKSEETISSSCESCSLLLVFRRDPPSGYAIPGGFVNIGESVETAAIREVKEETNLSLHSLEQFRMYSDPVRDKRRHTASIVFRCIVTSVEGFKGGDDAKGVRLVPLKDVLNLPLAFDHMTILHDYIQRYHPTVLEL